MSLKKLVRIGAYLIWALSFVALALCWKCNSWLPPHGIHFGDMRIAEGDLIGYDYQKPRDITFAWGNAQRTGYTICVAGGDPQLNSSEALQFNRITNWKRTDRYDLSGGDWSWDPDPKNLFNWNWAPSGIGVHGYHYYRGNDMDERDVWTADFTASRLWKGFVAASALFFVLRAVVGRLHRRRRGFPVSSQVGSQTASH